MKRVAALPQLLTAWLAALPPRRQELIQDLALGVALAAVNVVSLLPYRAQLDPLWLALALVAAQGLPLAWRRSHPVAVGLVVGVVRVAYDKIPFAYAPFPLGPAIALYTVFDRCGPFWRLTACVVAAAGLTVSVSSDGPTQPYVIVFQVMIFFTAGVAGVFSQAKRASIKAARTRADRAEAELDRQSAQAAERERTRIARELHDVVAHHVSLIAVQAEASAALLPERPDEAGNSVQVTGAGLGLAGIAERVASCGGNLAVGPTHADGFAVTARLPTR